MKYQSVYYFIFFTIPLVYCPTTAHAVIPIELGYLIELYKCTNAQIQNKTKKLTYKCMNEISINLYEYMYGTSRQ